VQNQTKLKQDKKEILLHLEDNDLRKDLNKMSNLDGFPLGEVDDLIKLSDPPEYTAYPNPYIETILEKISIKYDEKSDNYEKEPFVGDISEGKGDPIYNGHTYHTKVPHKAIINFIEHYTEKGDIVFDGFCGTGMTGVAANFTGRHAILNDLSPIATFIAKNNTSFRIDTDKIRCSVKDILNEVESELSWVYETKLGSSKGKINYVIWSDVFSCPHCKTEYLFCDLAIQKDSVITEYSCPSCSSTITKANSNRVYTQNGFAKQQPFLMNISINGKRSFKKPDDFDTQLISRIDSTKAAYWYPTDKLPEGDNFNQPIKSHKFTKVDDFFVKRVLLVTSKIFDRIQKISDPELRSQMLFIFTSFISSHATKMTNIQIRNGDYVLTNKSSGNLSVPSMSVEKNIFELMLRKTGDVLKVFEEINNSVVKESKTIITTQSSTTMPNVPSNSVDYIFVDPPFGANLMYSELNFIWEAWLRVRTNNNHEAIINNHQNKNLDEYKELMLLSFKEFNRILKPNRWITVEFHNSKASVWKAIQESLTKAGFILAQVATIDKQQGSFKQNTSVNAVKNDLVINAYKPSESFRANFLKKAGLNMEHDFIKMHLDKLPIEPNIERTQQMLYSKLLAQYIQNGFEVRMDAFEFYSTLRNHFTERDGFWFNSDQIKEYEKRLNLKKTLGKFDLDQTIIGINDEKTTIIWLASFLRKPRSYDDIYIEFSKKIMTSEDKIPELKVILEENFVTEDGMYLLPSLGQKKEREDMRIKRLLREFQDIIASAAAGKKINEVRKEALLVGLMKLYNEKNVDQIKLLGKKLDKKIIESDDDINAIIDWAMAKGD